MYTLENIYRVPIGDAPELGDAPKNKKIGQPLASNRGLAIWLAGY